MCSQPSLGAPAVLSAGSELAVSDSRVPGGPSTARLLDRLAQNPTADSRDQACRETSHTGGVCKSRSLITSKFPVEEGRETRSRLHQMCLRW